MSKGLKIALLITFLFLLTRFYNLGNSLVWEDNFSWLYRINYYPWILETSFKGIAEEGKGLKYAGTLSYHPGATLMTFSGLTTRYGKKILNKMYPEYEPCAYNDYECPFLKQELFLAKLPVILLSSLALFLAISRCSEKFGHVETLIFGAIMLAEPIFYITSRDLHLDFLQAILLFVAYLYFIYGDNKKDFLISSISFGLAILTRFSSTIFLPALLIGLLFQNRSIFTKQNVKRFLFFGLISAGVFVLLYPPMWLFPFNTIKHILSGSVSSIADHAGGNSYFSGLMTYITLIFRESSFLWVLLFFASIFWSIYMKVSRKKLKSSNIFFPFVVFLLFLNIADKRFYRYLTPVMLGFTLFIAVSVKSLFAILICPGNKGASKD